MPRERAFCGLFSAHTKKATFSKTPSRPYFLTFVRTEYDAPEVDNECVLDTAGIDIRPGDFCMATIEESSAYELVGRIKNVIP